MQAQNRSIDSIVQVLGDYKKNKSSVEKDSTYVKTLIELGEEYRYINSDSLLSIANRALALSSNMVYNTGIVNSYSLLGHYYSDKGKNTKAIQQYQKAIKIAKSLPNKNISLYLINAIAGEYGFLGDYSKALNGYLKGIDLATQLGNKNYLSLINENIANLYVSQKDYNQALMFFEKVIAINNEIGNEIYSAETFSNVASTYSEIGKFDYAMFNINKSISIFEKYQYLEWSAYAYTVKGDIYLGQKKFKWALYWYEQAKLVHREIQDYRSKIYTLNCISKTYLGLQKDELALEHAIEGFKIAKTINFLEGQKECANTLYKINKRKGNTPNALLYHEIYKNLSDSLTRDDNKKSLSLLTAKLDYEKQKQILIEKNEKALAKQQVIIYASLIIFLILGTIVLLVLRSHKIQKRLNKKLNHKTVLIKKREIELSKTNKTKNKLFSIIGHDLRGPIGTLQELLRMFSEGEIKKNELDGFIPKLKSDVDNVLFTLNNLLSWGQSQINGSSTRPKNFSITTIVDRNIKLLSEIASHKSINIINHIENSPTVWADLNQIDIVVRNLISNAIKFTQANGLITIHAMEKDKHWQIEVKDTGVGMTQDIQEKIFKDHSNVTTYGTNNEKGTGLGLSLCREMVEKNNGKIWVNSKINKGSSFYFTIPKSKMDFKQAS